MATNRILLPIPGGVAPDGTGSDNTPATPIKVVSTGTQAANAPKVSYVQLAFDQSTNEYWIWNFQLPGDYVSGGTLNLLWGAAAVSGQVVWLAGAEIADPESTDLDASVYNAATASAATTVPATAAGRYKETSITLTMTGATADDWISVFVGREADHANDTAASDAYLFAATFEYTA